MNPCFGDRKNKFYYDLATTSTDLVFCLDNTDKIIFANDMFYNITGYKNDDFLKLQDLLTKSSYILYKEDTKYIKEEDAINNVEMTFVLKNEVLLKVKGSIYSHSNRYISFIVRIMDSNRQKLLNLQKTSDIFEQISENMNDLIAVTDENFRYQWVGKSHRLLGYETYSLLGHNVFEYIHEDDIDRIKYRISLHKKGDEPEKIQYRFIAANGKIRWLETIGTEIKDERGNVTGYLFSSRDITQNKELIDKIISD